jgi:hypothetical protein
MIGRCQHCGNANVRLVWIKYQGRLMQVGTICAERIRTLKRMAASVQTKPGDGNS